MSNETSQKSIGKNIISPHPNSPNNNVGSLGGGNNSTYQTPLGKSPVKVRSWLCNIMREKHDRNWFVVVSDDAIIHPMYGWICDCGQWTFGDDEFHVPVYRLVKIKKRCGGRW